MSNRVTVIGHSYFLPQRAADREYAIEEVKRAIVTHGGNLTDVCHEICLSRRHMYRIVNDADLWDFIEVHRAKAMQERATVSRDPNWVIATRKALQ